MQQQPCTSKPGSYDDMLSRLNDLMDFEADFTEGSSESTLPTVPGPGWASTRNLGEVAPAAANPLYSQRSVSNPKTLTADHVTYLPMGANGLPCVVTDHAQGTSATAQPPLQLVRHALAAAWKPLLGPEDRASADAPAVTSDWQQQDHASNRQQQLVFCGLRVRCGVHSGPSNANDIMWVRECLSSCVCPLVHAQQALQICIGQK
jgi:hypothetical protein